MRRSLAEILNWRSSPSTACSITVAAFVLTSLTWALKAFYTMVMENQQYKGETEKNKKKVVATMMFWEGGPMFCDGDVRRKGEKTPMDLG